MNRLKTGVLLAVMIVIVIAAKMVTVQKAVDVQAANAEAEVTAKRDLLALMMAYPDHIAAPKMSEDGKLYVVMASGKEIIYDDEREKSFEEKLSCADIEDMMAIDYPLTPIAALMEGSCDPGRIRAYAFLSEVYGGSKNAVQANLTSVSDGTKICAFNSQNAAAEALAAAFQELAQVMKTHPEIYSFAYPTNGTFNYRVIAGTSQLSPHAFGIAIDLKSDPCDYWRWAGRQQGQSRLDVYPHELVAVFENHGFIWGGKWAHFDFLHYEYRPELIIKARYSVTHPSPWYSGFPDTDETQRLIALIDSVFSLL